MACSLSCFFINHNFQIMLMELPTYVFFSILLMLAACTNAQDELRMDANKGPLVEPTAATNHNTGFDLVTPYMQDIVLATEQTTSPESSAFVNAANVPRVLRSGVEIHIYYNCPRVSMYVGVKVSLMKELFIRDVVFMSSWQCDMFDSGTKKVRVELPDTYAYQPSYLNPVSYMADNVELDIWLMDTQKQTYPKISASYVLDILSPYERPMKPDSESWDWWSLTMCPKTYTPICQQEQDIFQVVHTPVVLSGLRSGVHYKLPTYNNEILEYQRKADINNPRFTLSVWVYVIEYCPNQKHRLCSVVQRISWDDVYLTPIVFINRKGQLHVQVANSAGRSLAYLSKFIVPLNQWRHLVVTFANNRINLISQNATHTESTAIRLPAMEVIKYNDTDGVYVFGGTEANPSYLGFMGSATIYRGQALTHDLIPMPHASHPMFGLNDTIPYCDRSIADVKQYVEYAQDKVQAYKQNNSCLYTFEYIYNSEDAKHCVREKTVNQPSFSDKRVKNWILYHIYTGQYPNLEEYAAIMYKNVSDNIESDTLAGVLGDFKELHQCGCYGNNDALYLVSTIVTSGLMKHQGKENMAVLYLQHAVLYKHRLSMMALAHNYLHGLNGFKNNEDLAYVYYKGVGDLTYVDRDIHDDDDVSTEKVRLMDDQILKAYGGEDGEVYQWVKSQADMGVARQQRNLGNMLFWGTHGLRRDVPAAIDLYRLAAETNSAAMTEYGLATLKGQGIDKNVTEGLEYLHRAAEQGEVRALNALGWYYMEKENNLTEAKHFFEKSYDLGNTDAAFNLGHLYSSGRFNHTIDKVKAAQYFLSAAQSGQLSASGTMATHNIRGSPITGARNVQEAIDWSRYISEYNPTIGRILFNAVQAYNKQDILLSFWYYSIAANTGVEIATFNLAYLCEHYTSELSDYIDEDCMWDYYNLSINRNDRNTHSYAIIKLGDYWLDQNTTQHYQTAVTLYSRAAKKHEPQGFYNLALLVEDNIYIPTSIWQMLNINNTSAMDKSTLVITVYNRCQEYKDGDIPCSLALMRVYLVYIWKHYYALVSICALAIVTAILYEVYVENARWQDRATTIQFT